MFRKIYFSWSAVVSCVLCGVILGVCFYLNDVLNIWTFLICVFFLLQPVAIIAGIDESYPDHNVCDECGRDDCAGRF